MTSHNSPTSGTESSVPGATQPSSATLAAFQTMLSAVASLNQANASAAAAAAAATAMNAAATPSPVVPTAAVATPAAAPAGFRTQAPWIADALYRVVPGGPLQAIPEAFSLELVVWYSITKGKWVGVTRSNSLAVGAVAGVSGSQMRSHKSQALALAAFNQSLTFQEIQILS
ncbi:hypothetical protein R3P38DRAFT_3219122 [Favolaschia claudopus]|uniref:Uncharacterized protein n=1 Tax=Favolaschia claudopus TaxID=2862362 RepID=A0AAW0A2U7_9AGAR